MNTYAKINIKNEYEEINEYDFFQVMKQQQYGTITQYALQGRSKEKLKYDADYETIEELDEMIKETINFVSNTPNYRYGNKYYPNLTAGKKGALKKLNRFLKSENQK